MKYSASDIASMVVDPFAGPEFTEEKISDEWESIEPDMTLLQCLNAVVDNYSQFIAGEIGWDGPRKLLAVEVEVKCRIRPKQVAPTGNAAA